MDLATVATVLAVATPLGGLVWHAATLAARVKVLEDWQKRHEPTAVELAELKVQLTALSAVLAGIKDDIQRLYDRTSRRGGAQ